MTIQQKKGIAIHIEGIVQGVGFRPFVYRLATEMQLAGSVCNNGNGVQIQAFATPSQLEKFLQNLEKTAPPLAKIAKISSHPLATKEFSEPVGTEFTILFSQESDTAQAAIPADIALCEKCAAEIVDKDNRRHNYPFTNCTDCGPRYTIVAEVPYDRPFTSMHTFPMCKKCQQEYDDPLNRRFHAQPNACPVCGPQLVAKRAKDGNCGEGKEPLAATAAALAAGEIVAIRALGGYQLAVDAENEKAVARLRSRKNRPDKPLAIMVEEKNLHHIARFTEKELTLLRSPQAPIVLLEKKRESSLAKNLAPNMGEVGVMLPATPLHYLLFADTGCPPFLVMTSGNLHGNPICRTVEEAEQELAKIADLFLHHNREILTRVDDSVTRIVAGKPLLLRRSRGYAPNSLRIADNLPSLPPLLACGAGLKNTFCLAQGRELIVSQHIGELENAATFDFFYESLQHVKKLYHIEPEIVICDKHPDYPSSHFAKELGLPILQVQHHHAHAAAVLLEHQLEEAIAIVLDGTGLGDDNTIWGGEILHTTLRSSRRLAHLSPISLPGGDMAAVEPWRMALAALNFCGIQTVPPALSQVEAEKRQAVQALLGADFHSPLTSSAGRLFDMAASILGVCQKMSYEGQAAMELEALANTAFSGNFASMLAKNLPLTASAEEFAQLSNGKWEINTQQFVTMLLDGLATGVPLPNLALGFHLLFINSFAVITLMLAKEQKIKKIVLSGGCMQNRLLLEGFIYLLTKHGMEVFVGEALPVNDGGISAGQAIVGGLSV